MKFIHAADIHLDSPLRGLERYDGAPVEAMRGATRRAFENLVDLALRSCLETLGSSQSVSHQFDHRQINPSFAGGHQALIILAEASGMVDPSECSLDHPAPRQQDEPAGFLGAQDDRQGELEAARHPFDQAPTVSAIDPDLAQFFAMAGQVSQEQACAVAILDAGRRDQHYQQQAQGIN